MTIRGIIDIDNKVFISYLLLTCKVLMVIVANLWAVTKTRTGLGLDWDWTGSILANSYKLMQARAYSDENLVLDSYLLPILAVKNS